MKQASQTAPRILIIRLSALGDILHALPVLAAIRRAKPQAHIGWIVQAGGAELVQGHPMLDRAHVIPRQAMKNMGATEKFGVLRKLRAEVRAEDYEIAIDLQGLAKSAVWGWLSSAKERVGFRGEDARELSGLLYNRAISPPADARHVILKNLSLLQALGISNPAVEFPVHFADVTKQRAQEIWGESDSGVMRVIVNPGAGWVTKQWPAARYGELAARLAKERAARVAIAWGPGEETLVREAIAAADSGSASGPPDFSSRMIPAAPGVYAMPATSFTELGATISLANLFVAGDTGPLHFAAALGVPSVGIFGASDPIRNGPWGEHTRVIQLTEPKCIPCWKTQCAWSEPLACLNGIAVDRILGECLKVLTPEAKPDATS